MGELRNYLSGTIFREWRTRGDTVTAHHMADAVLAEPRLSVELLPEPDSTDPDGRIYFDNHTIRVDRSNPDRPIQIFSQRAGGWAEASLPRLKASTLARLAAIRAAEKVR